MIRMGRPKTIMAFAAHHNRIGFVFLIGDQPMDWQLSYQAATSPSLARKKVAEWLRCYQPDFVLTEEMLGSQRKGQKALALIAAIAEVAEVSPAKHCPRRRQQPFANKYVQIEALCERFPQMRAVAPKARRFYDPEPPYVTLFEALALAANSAS